VNLKKCVKCKYVGFRNDHLVLYDDSYRVLKQQKFDILTLVTIRQTVKRASILRMNCRYIQPSAFAMRKFHFTASEKKHGFQGVLREKVASDAMNQMMNPNSMMKMMKGNMTFMVSNFVMMGLMGYFFGGFVLGTSDIWKDLPINAIYFVSVVKVPFSLTQKFKAMLQRGIEMK
jgi:hypothetical protein